MWFYHLLHTSTYTITRTSHWLAAQESIAARKLLSDFVIMYGLAHFKQQTMAAAAFYARKCVRMYVCVFAAFICISFSCWCSHGDCCNKALLISTIMVALMVQLSDHVSQFDCKWMMRCSRRCIHTTHICDAKFVLLFVTVFCDSKYFVRDFFLIAK